MKRALDQARGDLAEIRRRLGPYAALQPDEPYRLNDAGIARQLVELTKVVERLAEDVEIRFQALDAQKGRR